MNDKELCVSFESAFKRFVEYYRLDAGWSLTTALQNHLGVGRHRINEFEKHAKQEIGDHKFNVGFETINAAITGGNPEDANKLESRREDVVALRKAEAFKTWRNKKQKKAFVQFHKSYEGWTI